jgi:acyl-CoA synthetase (AMP-forming)/AMP-acid ligase II
MLRAHDDLRSHRGDRERPPARLALLSRNCWQFAVVAFATAKLG